MTPFADGITFLNTHNVTKDQYIQCKNWMHSWAPLERKERERERNARKFEINWEKADPTVLKMTCTVILA